ncbi:DNA primase [Larkinella arboricola]|uniref:DNA primase n=1 Tax=Larkinella arboricola TaxID=643671 RepID=A0A327XEB8_LARAB|nr:DNA primase [Larkinella arboricola]RAK02576.1 DNA primase [Larkinella arboricola]
MRIPEETIDRIRQSADIIDVISDYVSLKKRGQNWIACCPFHNEKTPSFNVSPSRQIYKCFGCGKAGDPVRFVMDIENIGYPEALRHLAKKYGIEVAEEQLTPDELIKQNERESLFIVLNFAKDYYHSHLLTSEEGHSIGLSYFRERGFLDNTVQAFELGYSSDQWDALLQEAGRRGYRPELLEKAGLVLSKEGGKTYDRFRGRVIFPIHNVSGRVIAFGARILKTDKNQPKYLNSPETEVYHKSQVLYGIFQAKNAIRQEDICYLTEGYTDVISLHQAGIKNVVASSGTSLTIEQIRLISRFTQNVTILYDGDAAGIKAALRGLDMVLEEGLNVSVATFPDGDDPDSYVRKVGAEAFRSYLSRHSNDFITFKTDILLKDAGDNPFKRAEIISEVIQSISKIPDPIKRQVFFQKTARQLQVDEQTLISESNRMLLNQQKQQVKQQEKAGPSNRVNQQSSVSAPPDLTELLHEFPVESPPTAPKTADPLPSKNRSPLFYQEEECIRLLINYGAHELEPDISVCHYMLSELGTMEFVTPIFNKMLNEIREGFLSSEIRTADYFLRHLNQDFQHQAISLVTVRHQLSENWQKHEIYVPTEVDKLADAAFGNILRLKKLVAEQQMKEIKQLISQTNDPVESDRLMLEYMHYKKVDIEIGRLLGTVIS